MEPSNNGVIPKDSLDTPTFPGFVPPWMPPRPQIVGLRDLAMGNNNPNSTSSNTMPTLPLRPRILGLRELGIMMNNKRQATLQPMRGMGSSRIDDDDSGTYDPNKIITPPRVIRKKGLKRIRLVDDAEGNKRSRTTKAARPLGYGLFLTFSFTTQAGLTLLRSLPPDQPPYPHTTFLRSTESLDHKSESTPDSEDGSAKESKSVRIITRRQTKPTVGSRRDDGLTSDQLTLGHPQRRGCKACFDVGDDECSLMENHHDYPCDACFDADIDCVYIEPPEFRKPCIRCKQKRIACSYGKDGGKGAGRCKACEEEDVSCCAAPLEQPFKPEKPKGGTVELESKAEASPAIIPRKYVSCNQCRSGRLKCNLRRNAQGPCSKCRGKGEECAFELLPANVANLVRKSLSKSKDVAKETSPDKFLSPNTLEKSLLEESYYIGAGGRKRYSLADPTEGFTKKQMKFVKACNRVNQGNPKSPELMGTTGGIAHVKIRTAFSHPISFFYVPPPNKSESCDWCKTPFYGLEGYGETTVEVIPAHDGYGYEEIGDGQYAGWGQRGYPPSRMCETCTLSRFDIISCGQHRMTFMEDSDPLTRDAQAWNKAVDALVDGDEAHGQLILTAKFCAICSALADYRCSNDGEHLHESSGMAGCGLCLCDTCNDLMVKMEVGKADREAHEGRRINVLDNVIREAKAGWAGYYGGESDQHVRADVSFLTTTGELYIRLLQGMGGYFDVSEQKTLGNFYDLTNENSTDEERSVDDNFRNIIEQAIDEKGRPKAFPKALPPRAKARKASEFNDPFIKPGAKPVRRMKNEKSFPGKGISIDWMETRPVTSKKSWAIGGGSGTQTEAYGESMKKSKTGRGRRPASGKELGDAIVISDDDDNEDRPILRGY